MFKRMRLCNTVLVLTVLGLAGCGSISAPPLVHQVYQTCPVQAVSRNKEKAFPEYRGKKFSNKGIKLLLSKAEGAYVSRGILLDSWEKAYLDCVKKKKKK